MKERQVGTKTLETGEYIRASTASASDFYLLQTQIRGMQMEIDILKETLNVLKKIPH
ncbi:hypothetical protein [Eubacterium sp. An11]|uniref:hypothetical protein n=1 Tax=Eubacterium sp. An11 TaxID=1965542 RepID=UPI0013A6744A|nr:hypothetical protein [Eubacterium sp. An11]